MSTKYTLTLKQKRQELGLSQEAFSARLNMSQSQYSKLERHALDPPLSLLLAICKALNCTFTELVYSPLILPEGEKDFCFTETHFESLLIHHKRICIRLECMEKEVVKMYNLIQKECMRKR